MTNATDFQFSADEAVFDFSQAQAARQPERVTGFNFRLAFDSINLGSFSAVGALRS